VYIVNSGSTPHPPAEEIAEGEKGEKGKREKGEDKEREKRVRILSFGRKEAIR
jgi:hypothetical protein